MAVITPIRPYTYIPLEKAPTRKARFGYYMPFAGVKYYAIFNSADIETDRIKIGPVGWRLSKPTKEKIAEHRVPMAA